MALDPGRRIGAYEIVGPLGSGGMGEVYRARDTRLGRPVAIKLVSAEVGADSTAHERLEREARLTSSLNHPNIVTVYDVGEVDGHPFIVMELVAGESLHARMASRRLKPKEVVSIAAQVAEGLAAAHSAGVVHRDLKPRNIMLTEDGRAKIVDFGLGKVAVTAATADDPTVRVQDLTDSHAVVGTAGYMSPEQVTNGRIDHRTDQFAFGAMLYEMLTGERAFRRNSPVQTMAAVVEHDPTPVTEINPAAPPELVTIVQRCLEKEPGRRYASTLDLARDLEDARAGFTPSPWPTSRPEPVRKPRPWWPTRQAVVWLTFIAVMALGAWTFWPKPDTTPDRQLAEARALLDRWDHRPNIDRAIEILSATVAGTPDDPIAHSALAEAYVRRYEYTQDASLIDRAHAEIARALDLANVAPPHVVRAMIDNLQNRYDDAISASETALAVNNRSSDAYRETGRAYLMLGRADEAEAQLKLAVSLNSSDWVAFHYLGAVYLSTGRYALAAEASQKAVQLAPEFTKASNNLASALGALDRFDEAAALLRNVAEQHQNATAYANLGGLYYGRGQLEEAVGEYERSVLMPDAGAEHWRNLGAVCYWIPGLRERSLEAYAEAVRLGEQERHFAPADQELTAALADAYAVLGRKDEAHATLRELEELEPTQKEVAYTIGSVYEQLGDRESALEWLGKAIAAGKTTGEIERSPWLAELTKDERYVSTFKR